MIISWLSLLLVVVTATALGQTPDPGERPVQVVYESDTRGYYLPCG